MGTTMLTQTTTKDRLNAAFKAMRKAGLIARQSFSCCGSCGGYEIARQVTAMIDAGKPEPTGCVFYHRQDTARFSKGGDLFLAYGQIGTQKHGDIGMTTEQVGKAVVKCLHDAGLEYEWDGDENTRILVINAEGRAEKARQEEATKIRCARIAMYATK